MRNAPGASGITSNRTGALPLIGSQRSASTGSGGAGARQPTSPQATPATIAHARKQGAPIPRLSTCRQVRQGGLPTLFRRRRKPRLLPPQTEALSARAPQAILPDEKVSLRYAPRPTRQRTPGG